MLQFSSFAALCPEQICKGLVDYREGAGLRDTREGAGEVKIYPYEKGTRGLWGGWQKL